MSDDVESVFAAIQAAKRARQAQMQEDDVEDPLLLLKSRTEKQQRGAAASMDDDLEAERIASAAAAAALCGDDATASKQTINKARKPGVGAAAATALQKASGDKRVRNGDGVNTVEMDIDEVIVQLKKLQVAGCFINMKIDIREGRNEDVLAKFKELIPGMCSICTLLVGDFLIEVDNAWMFCVERKNMSDLEGSQTDNRSTKQTANMKLLFPETRNNYYNRCRIIQLYEEMDFSGERRSTRSLVAAMVNKIVRDNFRIIISESAMGTVLWLLLLMAKCEEFHNVLVERWTKGQPKFDVRSQSREFLNLNAQEQAYYLETRDLPNKTNHSMLRTVHPRHFQFMKELLTMDRLGIGHVYALLAKFKCKRNYCLYLEKFKDHPQRVINDLKDLKPADPRCADSPYVWDSAGPLSMSGRKLGPKMAIRLFNEFHGTEWKTRGTGAKLDLEAGAFSDSAHASAAESANRIFLESDDDEEASDAAESAGETEYDGGARQAAASTSAAAAATGGVGEDDGSAEPATKRPKSRGIVSRVFENTPDDDDDDAPLTVSA
jgi:ERCC4-type nuclease